jgi:hypothetical protein
MQYFQIWQYFASCSFRSGMSADFLVELGSCARKVSSVCSTQKLTTGELSCAIFLDLAVFCFLIQKWNHGNSNFTIVKENWELLGDSLKGSVRFFPQLPLQ